MFGAALARQSGLDANFSFAGWEDALRYLFALADRQPMPRIIDEFPYLVKASPAPPSLLRREIDSRGPGQGRGNRARLLLCGSAMSVMGGLLAGNAPLRGRAGLEMVIKPFGYRDAAHFWGVTEPEAAISLHAIVGGTPASPRAMVGTTLRPADFGPWVVRTVRIPIARCRARRVTCWPRNRDPRSGALPFVLAAIAAGKRPGAGSPTTSAGRRRTSRIRSTCSRTLAW